jgi:hypothetical protein
MANLSACGSTTSLNDCLGVKPIASAASFCPLETDSKMSIKER